MQARVWACFENSACAQQPIVSSVSFAGSCLLLAVLATHVVWDTAWDVIVGPEVAVAEEIVGVNDEIRADICFLLTGNIWLHVSRSSWSTRLFARSLEKRLKSASSLVTVPAQFWIEKSML